MAIGYACLTIGVPDSGMKRLTLSQVTEKTLFDCCEHNLSHLKNILLYNRENNLRFFRISSDVIPLASRVENTLPWWEIFSQQLEELGSIAKQGSMRLSMHPGQYTVLNSPREDVVENAIEDLIYHARFLDSMGLDATHKLVLHVGGAYGNKDGALDRFAQNFAKLPQGVKGRLILENDDKLYTIGEVLALARQVGCPAVFDNLHHSLNTDKTDKSEQTWIEECATTWKAGDGRQKIHYSQQDPKKKQGSHSPTISLDDFLAFHAELPDKGIDIMLEVKDKNISALKCMHCLEGTTEQRLYNQWLNYLPLVTERDPSKVWEFEQLCKDGTDTKGLSLAFYSLLEKVLVLEIDRDQAAITAEAVAEKCCKTEAEKRQLLARIALYAKAEIELDKLKQSIQNLAEKHAVHEVLRSYYTMM